MNITAAVMMALWPMRSYRSDMFHEKLWRRQQGWSVAGSEESWARIVSMCCQAVMSAIGLGVLQLFEQGFSVAAKPVDYR